MAAAPVFAHAQSAPAAPSPARAAAAPVRLDEALRAIARASNTTILFSAELVHGRTSPAPRGTGPVDSQLRHALAGSGLTFRRTGAYTIVILPLPRRARPARPPPIADNATDIMVTALRRPTRLADTPVSLVAVTGPELARNHATGLSGLAALAPSLAVTTVGGGLNRLSLRGVYAAGEATVALYYGNVAVAGPGGSTSDPGMMTPDLMLVDIDRVEVLRGPQGTLFGTSSLAGTVRILFRQPDLDHRSASLDLLGALTQGGGGSDTLSGMVNLPLVPGTLALRAVGYSERKGGYLDMPRLGLAHTDRATRQGGRLALRWQPSADWRVDWGGIYQQSAIGNSSQASWGAAPSVNTGQVLTPFSDHFWMVSLDLHGHLGGVALDATLAHSGWTPRRHFDFSQSQLNHLGDGTACAAWYALDGGACTGAQQAGFDAYVRRSTPAVIDQPFRISVNSAELRLSGSGALTWTAGGFASTRHDAGISSNRQVDTATGLAIADSAPLSSRSFATKLDEYAFFADGSWQANGWLGLSGGGRFFHYAREAISHVATANLITGPFTYHDFDLAYRAAGAVGRARLELRPSPHALVYAQVSSGFRPGGINVVPGLPDSLATYRDDRLISWELGTRLSPGAGWHMDLAGFHQIWTNMQYAAASTDGSYGFITNIGSARINGAELSLRWQPRGAWQARLEATYTDARLSSDQASASATTAGLKGDRLPYVAPLAAQLELLYDHAIAQGLRLTGSISARYTARSYSAFRTTDTTVRLPMGNTATIDADIGLTRARTHVALFVQNLADTRAPITATSTLATNLVVNSRPRTVGLTLHQDF